MRIALVTQSQIESLIDLLCEINTYYNPQAPAARDVVRDHTVQNLLSPVSPHRLVVASRPDGPVLGLAAITFMYSLVEPEPAKRKQCSLKELFVSSASRSKGTGRALMAWVATYAREHGCHRIDWSVKAGNTSGIAFYKSLGASLVEDRLSFRLSESSVAALAASSLGSSSGA